MNTYILLRNNLETGPYVLAQLQQLGLKSNDLIWVECQSMSWRSPGEIPELKKLLDKTVADFPPTPIPAINNMAFTGDQIDEPGEKSTPSQTTILDKYKPVAGLSQSSQFEKNEETDAKYERSLEEIKEHYAKNLEARKKRINGMMPKWVPRAAVYAGLVLLGALLVLVFKKSGNKVPVIVQNQPSLPATFKTRPDTSSQVQEQQIISNQEFEEIKNNIPENSSANPVIKQPVGLSTKKPMTTTLKAGVEENKPAVVEEKVKVDPVSIARDEVPELKKNSPHPIHEQVSVKSNSYTIAALGGIRDLEMTVRNDSKFHLEKVTVELNYLNPGGIILKSEDIHFHGIQPNGMQTIPVKKTNRGVKVSYKIKKIESKETGLSSAGL